MNLVSFNPWLSFWRKFTRETIVISTLVAADGFSREIILRDIRDPRWLQYFFSAQTLLQFDKKTLCNTCSLYVSLLLVKWPPHRNIVILILSLFTRALHFVKEVHRISEACCSRFHRVFRWLPEAGSCDDAQRIACDGKNGSLVIIAPSCSDDAKPSFLLRNYTGADIEA